MRQVRIRVEAMVKMSQGIPFCLAELVSDAMPLPLLYTA